jgi:hypothetical protein
VKLHIASESYFLPRYDMRLQVESFSELSNSMTVVFRWERVLGMNA